MATSIISFGVLQCVLFGLCGFLGNWLKVSFFFSVDFLFGSLFSMLAILVVGRTYGVIAAFIAQVAHTCCGIILGHHRLHGRGGCRDDKKPYITDMLISKMGTPSPIVILLAPIVISGEYKGYCSGVVETSYLANFLRNLRTQDIHITLVDGQKKVIVSTSPDFHTNAPFTRPYLQPSQETSGYQPILWQPEAKPNTSLMQRWRHSFLFSSVQISENCRWRLIVEAPLLPVAEDISRYCLTWLDQILARGYSDIYEKEYRRKDGTIIPVELRAILARDAAGQPQTMWALVRDITERKRAEKQVKASLAEKEVMLKEIHHRVKNNLQVISSLVSLQAENLTDDRVRDELNDVRDRVRLMALIHEKLYQASGLANLNFADYSAGLLRGLWDSHGTLAEQVRLNLTHAPVELSIEKAIPCGLILNELACNALKHAFPNSSGGEVTVGLEHDVVTDAGVHTVRISTLSFKFSFTSSYLQPAFPG